MELGKIVINKHNQAEIIFTKESPYHLHRILILDILQDLSGDITHAYDYLVQNDVEDFGDYLDSLDDDSCHFIVQRAIAHEFA